MVIATANITDTVHKELKTLPGAYVDVRRLTYGEKLQRRAMVSGMKVRGGGKGKRDDFEGEMNLVNEAATIFDFQRCIVDHNLEMEVIGEPGEDGKMPTKKMDLGNTQDIRKLDPRVGEEIDGILSELNNFEEDDEEGEG